MTYHRRYWLKNKVHLTECRLRWKKRNIKKVRLQNHLNYLKNKDRIKILRNTVKYKRLHKKWHLEGYYKKRMLIWELKSNPCMDCKQWFNPWQMEFDHVYGRKKNNIGFMITRNFNTLFKEIQKCQLVCANCHKNRTFSRN